MRRHAVFSFSFLAVLALGGCGTDPTVTTDNVRVPADLGVLEGTVYFVGVPCRLNDPPRPPCDGPYPEYEVVVYHADGTSEAARTQADKRGRYRVELQPGSYVIFTQNGIRAEFRARYEVTLTAGQRTLQDLVVDTGVR